MQDTICGFSPRQGQFQQLPAPHWRTTEQIFGTTSGAAASVYKSLKAVSLGGSLRQRTRVYNIRENKAPMLGRRACSITDRPSNLFARADGFTSTLEFSPVRPRCSAPVNAWPNKNPSADVADMFTRIHMEMLFMYNPWLTEILQFHSNADKGLTYESQDERQPNQVCSSTGNARRMSSRISRKFCAPVCKTKGTDEEKIAGTIGESVCTTTARLSARMHTSVAAVSLELFAGQCCQRGRIYCSLSRKLRSLYVRR